MGSLNSWMKSEFGSVGTALTLFKVNPTFSANWNVFSGIQIKSRR